MQLHTPLYQKAVEVTGLPWPDFVKNCIEDYRKYGTEMCWLNHSGLDMLGKTDGGSIRRVPLYAISDGKVLHIANPETPNGRYLTYEYSGISPAVLTKNGKKWCAEHMEECVLKLGQIVRKNELIGYQGWTGHVIPRSVWGTHCHFKMFDENDELIDPMLYLTGAIELPAWTEEEEMVTIPGTKYKYISSRGNLRSEPRVATETLTGRYIMPNDVVEVTAWQKDEEHTWAKVGDVWFAAVEGGSPWVEAVSDNSLSLMEKITALENQAIALEHNFVLAQAEAGRLSAIIDAGRFELDKK